MSRFFSISLALLVMTTSSFGQVTATFTASVRIETPVGTTRLDDPSFGTFPINSHLRSVEPMNFDVVTSTVGNAEANGTMKLAAFKIFANCYAYDISMPSSGILFKRRDGVETMTVDAFTINSSSDGPTQMLGIGTTLNMDDFHVAGEYVSITPFTLMVNYN